ncbi:NBPF family member NBPF8-like [Equus przewalskii]|uniref:NBPF family member NBPF8-like n=1 Tax=Equus przewalskii TaxID=9798 RepID=A0ABM4NFJ1_EQUPR
MTSSSHQDLSASHELPSTNVFLSEEHADCSALGAATEYSHRQEKRAPTGLPETRKDQKDEEREQPTAPRELQEEEMNDMLQDSLDEQYLTLSSHHDLSDSCLPPDSPTIPSDEHEICSCLDGAFQARELTQLHLKTREGRELSVLLNQNLKDLLARSDLNNLQGQVFQEQLAEGCRQSQALVSKLSPENHEDEAEEQLGSLTPRKYHFLIHDHAGKLTQIRQTSREGREVSVLLHQHLRDLLIHSDLGSDWGQGFREQLAEGRRLAEHLVCKLSPENLEDDEDEEEQESLTPSLERELQEVNVNEILQDPSVNTV